MPAGQKVRLICGIAENVNISVNIEKKKKKLSKEKTLIINNNNNNVKMIKKAGYNGRLMIKNLNGEWNWYFKLFLFGYFSNEEHGIWSGQGLQKYIWIFW